MRGTRLMTSHDITYIQGWLSLMVDSVQIAGTATFPMAIRITVDLREMRILRWDSASSANSSGIEPRLPTSRSKASKKVIELSYLYCVKPWKKWTLICMVHRNYFKKWRWTWKVRSKKFRSVKALSEDELLILMLSIWFPNAQYGPKVPKKSLSERI